MSKFLPTLFLVTILVVGFGGMAQGELILHFTFDSADGDTVPDMVGDNDGTLSLATIVADAQIGSGALEFMDQNASMTVENFEALAAYQDNTYAFWLKFIEGSNTAWSQIIAKKAPGSDRSPGIWMNPDGTGLHYRYEPGNMGYSRIGPDGENSNFLLDQWFHIAGIKEGETLTVLIDGVQVADPVAVPAPHAQGFDIPEEKLYIGLTGYRAATFRIDDLGIYDHALTANEVADIMNNGIVAVSPKGKLATTWASIKF